MASDGTGRLRVAIALLALAAPAGAAWKLSPVAALTRSGQTVAPAISPDGRRVSYLVGTRLEEPGRPDVLSGRLWTLDRATGKATRTGRLNVDAVQGERPIAYAPRGSAYAYVEGDRSSPVLWYVNADGDRFRVGTGRAASFSPDGKYLAYIVWDRGGPNPVVELWLFITASHESKRLARLQAEASPLEVALTPRFSADGTRILWHAGARLLSYARAQGRSDRMEGNGGVDGFDVDAAGQVVYYLRGAEAPDEDGLYRSTPDLKKRVRVFPDDELPARIADVTAGPDPDTVLFLADTAPGRGLVAADLRERRWRYLGYARSFARQPGGTLVVREEGEEGRREVQLDRLVQDRRSPVGQAPDHGMPVGSALSPEKPARSKEGAVGADRRKTNMGGRT